MITMYWLMESWSAASRAAVAGVPGPARFCAGSGAVSCAQGMSQIPKAAMVDTNTSAPRLKESIVKDALSTFCWKKLEHHLDAIQLNEDGFEQFLGHLRRCNELILKYPNDKMAARRADFFAKLRQRILDDLGAPALDRLETEIH